VTHIAVHFYRVRRPR